MRGALPQTVGLSPRIVNRGRLGGRMRVKCQSVWRSGTAKRTETEAPRTPGMAFSGVSGLSICAILSHCGPFPECGCPAGGEGYVVPGVTFGDISPRGDGPEFPLLNPPPRTEEEVRRAIGDRVGDEEGTAQRAGVMSTTARLTRDCGVPPSSILPRQTGEEVRRAIGDRVGDEEGTAQRAGVMLATARVTRDCGVPPSSILPRWGWRSDGRRGWRSDGRRGRRSDGRRHGVIDTTVSVSPAARAFM